MSRSGESALTVVASAAKDDLAHGVKLPARLLRAGVDTGQLHRPASARCLTEADHREQLQLRDRGHFLLIAAMSGRQIVSDRAPRRLALKRGSGAIEALPRANSASVGRQG